MKIRTFIIDDDPFIREELHQELKGHFSDFIEVKGVFDNALEALDALKNHPPQLIFLDIQMDDGTGFDLLEKVKNPEFFVIFTTAFDNHAVKAFKYAAVDYLLKPIDPDELLEAVSKVRKKQSSNQKRIDHLMEVRHSGVQDRIALSSQDSYTLVRFDQIMRLESDSNYTHFHLTSKEKITVPKSLKEFEDILPTNIFFRTHQSHIINVTYVKKFIKEDGGYVLMEDGTEIMVARRRKDEFIKMLTGQE